MANKDSVIHRGALSTNPVQYTPAIIIVDIMMNMNIIKIALIIRNDLIPAFFSLPFSERSSVHQGVNIELSITASYLYSAWMLFNT